MRGDIQIIEISFNSAVFRKCLAQVADEFFDGPAENGRILALVALEHPQRLVHLPYLFYELVDLLFCDVAVKALLYNSVSVIVSQPARLIYFVLSVRGFRQSTVHG